tara:strand:+ start:805 stop:987 length:183 start_codon:yes stop_codon:yes gene_type:complete
MLRKIVAVIVCFVLWMTYTIFLESNGIRSSSMGGAIPAVIFISIIIFVWKKITKINDKKE